MIILHNRHRLQNQCFRPSKERTHSTATDPSAVPKRAEVEKVIEMRKSYSSGEYFTRKETQSHLKEKQKFQLNNWMCNHFLNDVKQKFKEMFKHKNQREENSKQLTVSPKKNSTQSSRKMMNWGLNCQSVSIIDKRMLNRSQLQRKGKNKRLIDLKRGRLYRGTQRDYNEFVKKQMNSEYEMGLSRLSQRQIGMEEEIEESYLRSQYAMAKQKKEEREEDRMKTEKKTIQPVKQHPLIHKQYEGEMLGGPNKRESPLPQEEQTKNQVKQFFPAQIKAKLLNQQYFSVKNRKSISQREQRNRQYDRQFTSKVSLQLNYQF